jgi:VIT1/CCC1 family predicted Fe2+/Mn2+ transporter
VWAIDSSATTEQPPLGAKCARHVNDRNGVCCKELKDDDERQLVDPDIVRDVVIGLSDGLTVPFALTAGLSSLGSSRVVVLGGLAELIAGAISMGIGGFLASQAERDHYRYLRRTTTSRVLRSCDGEMQREVHAILGPLGVKQELSTLVANALLQVEEDTHGVGGDGHASEEESGLRWSKEVGLSAFLLKFGEGLEEVPDRRMYISAFTIGMGYLVGGFIPLLPYFFVEKASQGLLISSIITAVVLLIFGTVKARVSGAARKKRDYVWGAVSTLLVGGGAAAVAYGVVALLETS